MMDKSDCDKSDNENARKHHLSSATFSQLFVGMCQLSRYMYNKGE